MKSHGRLRCPLVYPAHTIAEWHISEQFEPGRWRPARPCAFFEFRLKERLRTAWRVFIGKYDALNWGDMSGEWTNDQVDYKDVTDPGFILSGKSKKT